MKKLTTTLTLWIIALGAFSQTQTSLLSTSSSSSYNYSPVDKSPLDLSYFPSDYPRQKSQGKTVQPLVARILYSRPQKNNRVIFGDLVEYGKVWRLGANEATEIEFFKDVKIEGKKILKGRYTLYAIPTPAKWTLIINKDTDTWGAFVYDEKKDVLRVDEPVQTLANPVEILTINFMQTSKGTNLIMTWDNVSITLPVEIK